LLLHEGKSYDVAAVRIRLVDEYGNTLPFANDPVTLEAEGTIELIGPGIISLQGGMGGTYVRTTGEEGEGRLTIRTAEGLEETIQFTVDKA
jgi:beta-galactosidase